MASAVGACSFVSRLVLRRVICRQPVRTLQSTLCTVAPQSANQSGDSPPPAGAATSTPATPTPATSTPATPTPAVEEMQKQIEQLRSHVEDLDDKYKRSLAERENVRNRLEKQVQDGKLFGIQSFCKDLFDVADILGKATESVPPEQITDNNPHLKSLFEGLRMTEAQLFTVFRRHGVRQINALGAKFDPNLHEALFEQAVEGHEPGHVCLVTKNGYTLHERTIRPALVGVAKAPLQ